MLPEKKKKRGSVWILVLLILSAILLAAAALFVMLSPKGKGVEPLSGSSMEASVGSEDIEQTTRALSEIAAMGTEKPIDVEPEATLPLIMTNTPTPTPTATPEPTPTPTPGPTPTPLANLASGKVTKEANLRAAASSSAKIKKKLKKGAPVTIHEAIRDDKGDVWYYITDVASSGMGWIRDYLVNVTGGSVTAPVTPTPDATQVLSTAGETQQEEGVLAVGKLNHEANIRKVMNGQVVTKLSKGVALNIYEIRTDKNGKKWYKVRPVNGSKIGYVQVQFVDSELEIESSTPEPTAIPAPTKRPKRTPTLEPDEWYEDEEEPELQTEKVQDRDYIGTAKTNRALNVRQTPTQNGKLVRQLSEGVEVQILGLYVFDDAQWYDIRTPSGKTRGYARVYTLDVIEIDESVQPQVYLP